MERRTSREERGGRRKVKQTPAAVFFYSFYAELLSIDMNNQSGCEGNLVSHYSC